MAAVAERERSVRSLLHKDLTAALRKALENPPVGTRDKAVKDKNTDVVLDVLGAAKDAQLAPAVAALSAEESDALMKYVYRGLAKPAPNGALFRWHAAVLERGGVGCVVRAVADRRTV
ncbi:actin related protein 2/3 complex, subunit 5 [Tribonema minus]|uniref:Actin-related protein 2/3 complex subunit 5 n=1 Tax=Tribonema minus TaxID=303371 RepID=A0A835ZBW9_9STRA|nr:actin related protein 2/3 complex, subunit 5 [Tribonema minus]